MTNEIAPQRAPAAMRLHQLIEELGAWRVLGAVFAALMSGRGRRLDARRISAHLRRDIGLPPSAAPPVGRGQFW